MSTSTKSTGHAVCHTFYHLVWSTKYRRKVLVDGVDSALKDYLGTVARARGYRIEALEVMPDHVHAFVSFPPKFSVAHVIKDLKGSSARHLYAVHPEIKRLLWGGNLWNPSYYVGTAGSVSASAIHAYIEEQKTT